MRSRSNLIFAAIFGLAIVATVLVFTIGPGFSPDATPTGKMSVDVIGIEREFREIQKEWNENERAFAEAKPEISKKLTGVQARIKKLSETANGTKGASQVEAEALPHLVAAIKALVRIVEPYVLRLMAPQLVPPERAEQVRKDTKELNAEWIAWQEATKTLSR